MSICVYRDGVLVARTLYFADAAAIAGMTPGSVVKCHGKVVWVEGQEEIGAGDSWLQAAEIMSERAEKSSR